MVWALELNGIQPKSARWNGSDSYRAPGAVKMAFDFNVADAGGGWSTLVAETRVVATDELTRRAWAVIGD